MRRILKTLLKKIYTFIAMRNIGQYKERPHVNFYSRFTAHTILGKNTHFNGMRISGRGKVTIGDNFHSGKDCLIITQNHNYNGARIPYDDTYIVKDVTIKDNVWLGDRVIVLAGAVIGEGAIIQAGSVVVNNIPDYAIAGGHPAKVFASRDIAHYQELKEKELFH